MANQKKQGAKKIPNTREPITRNSARSLGIIPRDVLQLQRGLKDWNRRSAK